jgi:hypothetical protein
MQRQAGGSFLQVLHGLRLEHARGLLGDPRQKMIDVALASGFGSVDGDSISLTRDGLMQVDRLLHDFFLPQHRDARYT